jgi:hypothetical protein
VEFKGLEGVYEAITSFDKTILKVENPPLAVL